MTPLYLCAALLVSSPDALFVDANGGLSQAHLGERSIEGALSLGLDWQALALTPKVGINIGPELSSQTASRPWGESQGSLRRQGFTLDIYLRVLCLWHAPLDFLRAVDLGLGLAPGLQIQRIHTQTAQAERTHWAYGPMARFEGVAFWRLTKRHGLGARLMLGAGQSLPLALGLGYRLSL